MQIVQIFNLREMKIFILLFHMEHIKFYLKGQTKYLELNA